MKITIYITMFFLLIGSGLAVEPVISNIYVLQESLSKVIITFDVNTAVNWSINYGPSRAVDWKNRFQYKKNVDKKRIEISNLEADKTYYYNITLCTTDRNCKKFGIYNFRIRTPKRPSIGTDYQDKDWGLMDKGKNEMKIENEDWGLRWMFFTISRYVQDTSITVEKLDKRPSDLPYLTTKIYRYFNVTKTNIPSNILLSMDVHFSVSRHWIDISEIEEEEIALFIYDNGWKQLNTILSSKDAHKAYYIGVSNKVGVIAIGKRKHYQSPPSTTSTVSITTSTTTTTTTTIINQSAETESPKNMDNNNNNNNNNNNQMNEHLLNKNTNSTSLFNEMVSGLPINY